MREKKWDDSPGAQQTLEAKVMQRTQQRNQREQDQVKNAF